MNLRKNLKNFDLINVYDINEINLFWKINFDDTFITKRIFEKKI